jgi:hypothetical protein
VDEGASFFDHRPFLRRERGQVGGNGGRRAAFAFEMDFLPAIALVPRARVLQRDAIVHSSVGIDADHFPQERRSAVELET